MHCRTSKRRGREHPAKNSGGPLDAGGTCAGCSPSSSSTAPQRAARILSAGSRVEISHGKDSCSWEKGGLRDYGQEPSKLGINLLPPEERKWGLCPTGTNLLFNEELGIVLSTSSNRRAQHCGDAAPGWEPWVSALHQQPPQLLEPARLPSGKDNPRPDRALPSCLRSTLPVPSSMPAHSSPHSVHWPHSLWSCRSQQQPWGGLGFPTCAGCPWPDPAPLVGAPRFVLHTHMTETEQSCYFCPQHAESAPSKRSIIAPKWGHS